MNMSINYNSGIMTLYTRCGTHKNDQTKWRLPTIFWSSIEKKIMGYYCRQDQYETSANVVILSFEASITTVPIIVLCIIIEIQRYLVKLMG